MSLQVGDKVRIAPHVTDKMLRSIYIVLDDEIADVRSLKVVQGINGTTVLGGQRCDINIEWVVPGAWLTLVEDPTPGKE